MGQDKAHLPWGDRTLVEHVIETLRPVTDEIIVVAKDAVSFSHLRARVVEDLVRGAHALGGLYTGLRLAAHERCFVCACDTPFLNPALIQFLIQQADGWDLVIPRTREGLQPLHAVYRRSILPAMEEQLRMQQWDLRALVPNVRARVIGPEQIARLDPAALSFFNVNTPEDYATAQVHAGKLVHSAHH
jgi:molybdopterin-guanine dinucleotide biosynthesis protein A